MHLGGPLWEISKGDYNSDMPFLLNLWPLATVVVAAALFGAILTQRATLERRRRLRCVTPWHPAPWERNPRVDAIWEARQTRLR